MLEIDFLDGPSMRWEGQAMDRPSRQDGRRLLVCLLLGALASRSRQDLAALLWPETDRSMARSRLRQALHNLRQALPPDAPDQPWILADRREIAWNRDSHYRLDLSEILAVAASVQSGKSDFRPRLAGHLSRAVLGDPSRLLPGYDEPWLRPWRNHFETARGLLREGLIESLRESGALDEALAGALTWSRETPLDEAAHRWLMRLHLEMGDRAAALSRYEACRSLLETELRQSPSAETEALRARVLAAAAESTAPSRSGRERPARIAEASPSWSASLAMVSRVDERGRRAAAAAEALHAGSLLSLVGPGGRGKSRLAAELAERWLERGRTLFAFAGDALWDSPDDPASATGSRLARSRSAAFDCEAGLSGIAARLYEPSSPRGALWLLDDVDPCLSEAARATRLIREQDPTARVLVTARQPLRAQGETLMPLSTLSLQAGGEAESLLLQLASAVGYPAPAGEPLRRLVRATGGNPLTLCLVASLLGSRTPESLIEDLESSADLDCGLEIEPERHRSLRASLAWGHALLSAESSRMLALIFAHGSPLTLEEVAALGPAAKAAVQPSARVDQANPAETLASLAELVRFGFVEVARGSGRETRYQTVPGLAALLARESDAKAP